MTRQGYEYYAFISYSHSDEKWAKWLQKKLETYRFPTAVRRKNTWVPKKIFPICRDLTDISSGGYTWEQIRRLLNDSAYLIVICSPNSTRSDWVGREIRHFKETGRGDRIIPFIVAGEPHSMFRAQEAYHRELLNYPFDFLGASVSELGKRNAVLRVAASLLNLKYDSLIGREKKRRLTRRIAAIALITATLAAAGGLLWYEMPHSYYYYSYVYRNELPVGLHPISEKEREHAHDYYKIVKQRNTVVRLEHINSAGNPTASVITTTLDDPVVQEFSFDNGELRVVQRDTDGNTLMTKSYKKSMRSVEFYNPDDDTQAYALPSDMGTADDINSRLDPESEKSEITRQLMEYDENGYLKEVRYMRDNHNDSYICDENGIYGKRYERDGEGKIITEINLGKDGNPLRAQHGNAVAYTKIEYDENYGRVKKTSTYDADMQPAMGQNEVFSDEIEYGESGNVRAYRTFNANGELCNNLYGVAEYQTEYDDRGFLTSMKYFDESGEATYDKSNLIHEIRYTNNDDGRATRYEFFDTDGEPMICSDGYASYTVEYDENNRIISNWHYGLDGELVCNRSGHIAGCTVEYIDEKNLSIYRFYGADSKLISNGVAIIRRYRENGLLIKEEANDADDNPIKFDCKAASISYGYDEMGRLTNVSYYDENGNPCLCNDGYASVKYEYDTGTGKIKKRSYYNTEGKPGYKNTDDGSYSVKESEYNDLGQETCYRYFNANGKAVSVNGVHERRFEYDDNSRNWIKESYYDVSGNLVDNSEGYAVAEATYNTQGNRISTTCIDKDSNPVKKYEAEYNNRNQMTRYTKYTLNDAGIEYCLVTEIEYDSRGNIVSEIFRDKNGRLTVNQDGVARIVYKYNKKDQLINGAYYGTNKKLINNSSGLAAAEFEYDEFNNRITERYYKVSISGKPVLDSQYSVTFDEYGKILNITPENIN